MNGCEINIFFQLFFFHLSGLGQASLFQMKIYSTAEKLKAIPAVLESSRQENRLVKAVKYFKCYFICSVVTN